MDTLPIATIITLLLINKFSLSPAYSVALTPAINLVLTDLPGLIGGNIEFINPLEHIVWYHWVALTIVSIFMYGYTNDIFRMKTGVHNIFKRHIDFNVYDKPSVDEILEFFKVYPETIEKQSVNNGTYRNTGLTEYTCVMYPYQTRFNIDGVKGYIQTSFTPTTKCIQTTDRDGKQSITTQNIEIPFITIIMDKKNISYPEFHRMLVQKLEKKDEQDKKHRVLLYGVVVGPYPSSTSTFSHNYPTMINNTTVLLDLPRKKYNKETIWSNYFCEDKELMKNIIGTNQFNLLLHGPPGTGKSKFIEIAAKILERHIVSINLKHYQKSGLDAILLSPTIKNKVLKTKDVIFVLEELDHTIKYLKEKQEHHEEGMKNTEKRVFSIENMNKYMNEIFIHDLLEIFQSSVPRDGQIIIATTNNFDGMRDILPALFRPGRMTPLFIGYPSQKQFRDIVQHHFNREPTIQLPDCHTIPTSQITEQAAISHGDYNLFCKLMTKIIQTQV
jgi:hypothetical protein